MPSLRVKELPVRKAGAAVALSSMVQSVSRETNQSNTRLLPRTLVKDDKTYLIHFAPRATEAGASEQYQATLTHNNTCVAVRIKVMSKHKNEAKRYLQMLEEQDAMADYLPQLFGVLDARGIDVSAKLKSAGLPDNEEIFLVLKDEVLALKQQSMGSQGFGVRDFKLSAPLLRSDAQERAINGYANKGRPYYVFKDLFMNASGIPYITHQGGVAKKLRQIRKTKIYLGDMLNRVTDKKELIGDLQMLKTCMAQTNFVFVDSSFLFISFEQAGKISLKIKLIDPAHSFCVADGHPQFFAKRSAAVACIQYLIDKVSVLEGAASFASSPSAKEMRSEQGKWQDLKPSSTDEMYIGRATCERYSARTQMHGQGSSVGAGPAIKQDAEFDTALACMSASQRAGRQGGEDGEHASAFYPLAVSESALAALALPAAVAPALSWPARLGSAMRTLSARLFTSAVAQRLTQEGPDRALFIHDVWAGLSDSDKTHCIVQRTQGTDPALELARLTTPEVVNQSIHNNLQLNALGKPRTNVAWGAFEFELAHADRRLRSDLAHLLRVNAHIEQLLLSMPVSRHSLCGNPYDAAINWIAGRSRSAADLSVDKDIRAQLRQTFIQFLPANLFDINVIDAIHQAVYQRPAGQDERCYRNSSTPMFMGSDIARVAFAKALENIALKAQTAQQDSDALLFAALIAYHPYGDGNGRTARTLYALAQLSQQSAFFQGLDAQAESLLAGLPPLYI